MPAPFETTGVSPGATAPDHTDGNFGTLDLPSPRYPLLLFGNCFALSAPFAKS
jgi:hypothetical protein